MLFNISPPSKEDEIVEKLFLLHFPTEAVTIETQTQVKTTFIIIFGFVVILHLNPGELGW